MGTLEEMQKRKHALALLRLGEGSGDLPGVGVEYANAEADPSGSIDYPGIEVDLPPDEKVVDATVVGEPPARNWDAEAAQAHDADRDTNLMRNMSIASRRFMAGMLGNRRPSETLIEKPSAEAGVRAEQSNELKRAMEERRQRLSELQGERLKRQLADDANKPLEREKDRTFKASESEKDRTFKATEAQKRAEEARQRAIIAAAARAKREKEKAEADAKKGPTAQDLREEKWKTGTAVRPGWRPIVKNAPTFRDVAQAKGFDDTVAAFGALENHKNHVMETLAQFKEARSRKDVAKMDELAGVINQQMGNLASKMRVAEGLNNSDAANQAIEQALSLSHGTLFNTRNAINEGRIDAILNSAIDSAHANLVKTGRAMNIEPDDAPAEAPAGIVTFVDESGEEMDVPAEKAEAFQKAHPNVKRKGG